VQKRVPGLLRTPQLRHWRPGTPVSKLWPQVVQKRLIGWFGARHRGQEIQLPVCCG